MRTLTVFTVLILAPVAMAAQDKTPTAQDERYAQQTNQAVTVPSNCHCTNQTEQSKEEPQGWHKFVTWPEGIATWGLLLTLCAIVWQSCETRKSAKAALKSVKVQEAGMGQWVDVEPLGCYIQTPPAGKGDFPFTINLQFEAVNNTAYPFDIQKIVTKISMWPYEWEVFTVETSVTLASQEKSRSKRYAFYVPTQSITKEGFTRGTVLTINGEITFRNCLGRTKLDYFGGLYRCGQIDSKQKGIFQYLEALGMVPERTNEKENPPKAN